MQRGLRIFLPEIELVPYPLWWWEGGGGGFLIFFVCASLYAMHTTRLVGKGSRMRVEAS